MKKIIPLLFVLSSCNFTGLAQSPELRSLQASLYKINDSLLYVDALNRIAMLLYEKNIDSTFYYSRQAQEIAVRLDYEKGKADAQNNLGIFFDIKGNLQLALRYYNEAYASYTNLNDSVNRVQTLMNIAMVYKEIGKDQRAIRQYEAALKLGKSLSKDSIMSLAIFNYVLQYPGRFSRDSMSRSIETARDIATRYKDERVLLAIDQLTAGDMISRGKRQQGLALLEQTIATAISKKLYFVSMDMLIDMGDQLVDTQPENAVRYYKKGLEIAKKQDYLIYSQLIARKLFDFYIHHKDSIKAVQYSHQLIELYDKQEELDNASSIDYLDYIVKDQQVRSLELRSTYQSSLLFLAVAACLLALIFILMIRKNLKRTKQLNARITTQNTEMKKALNALEQSQADNTRMMKIAAHDLRNPIGGMYSIAELMLHHNNRSEEDRMLLEMIKTSGQNSLDLVNELLHIQSNTDDLKKEPVDIDDMLHYCVSLLLNKAEAKGQQITLHAQPFTLLASREKLWRVVSNLIANAIKFSPSGASIDVKMECDTRRVLIVVKDHGIGIPSEFQDKIFDMFTEAKRPGTAGEQAFGLGLAISKQIVEAHGGKIWFESIEGKGTSFFVELFRE